MGGMAADFRRHRSGERDDTSRPVLITGARESYQDELAARKKRYFILMSVRIPALLLAAGALTLWNNPWVALAIVIGSIPVPWIAVIMANDRPPLPKGQARRYTAGALPVNMPRALPSSLTGTHHESDDDRSADRNGADGSGADTKANPRADTDPETDSDSDSDEGGSGP